MAITVIPSPMVFNWHGAKGGPTLQFDLMKAELDDWGHSESLMFSMQWKSKVAGQEHSPK